MHQSWQNPLDQLYACCPGGKFYIVVEWKNDNTRQTDVSLLFRFLLFSNTGGGC